MRKSRTRQRSTRDRVPPIHDRAPFGHVAAPVGPPLTDDAMSMKMGAPDTDTRD
jgi:hypothetical protein